LEGFQKNTRDKEQAKTSEEKVMEEDKLLLVEA
jgi:hypothetical protein